MTTSRILAALSLALAASACGSDTKVSTPTPDLTPAAVADMTTTAQPDMTTTVQPDMTTTTQPDMTQTQTADMVSAADLAGPQTLTVHVGQGGLKFVPSTLTIKAGDTVHWVWDGNNHNVVSGGPAMKTPDNKFCNDNDTNCASAPTHNQGFTYDHTFAVAGSYPYYCAPHFGAGMKGTIIVK